MGATNVYSCDFCPLILQLGGHTGSPSDATGVVTWLQVACASCGTMHRLTEQNGTCQATALPGPVRVTRTVTLRDVGGAEVESYEWTSESDWLPVGPYAGGIAAARNLPCSNCGRTGQMMTLSDLLDPAGNTAGRFHGQNCPVCGHQMRLLAITDSI